MKFVKNVLVCFMILVLSGCNVNKKVSNVKEVEFWTLQLNSFQPYIESVIKEYESQHPDVKIKWIDVPFSEGEKRALASIMSKSVPDLINLNPDFASTLGTRGALNNIGQELNRNISLKYISSAWDLGIINGKTYGIPWYITTSVTFYNKKLLSEAGLSVSDLPKKYAEIYEFSKVFKEKTGKYAFMPALAEGGFMLKNFNMNGSLGFKEGQIDIANDENTKILEMYQKMYKEKLIPLESITQEHRASLEKFMGGDIALIVTGANFAKIIKENSPEVFKNLGVETQITGASGKYDFSMMNLVIPQKAKYPKEALDFALFLTNANNQLEFCKLAPILPSAVKSLDSDYFKTKENDLMSIARKTSAVQLYNAVKPIPPLKNRSEINEIVDNMTQSVLLGNQSAQEGLIKAENEINAILSED